MIDTTIAPVESATLNELKDILDDEFPLLVNTYIQDVDQRMARLRNAIGAAEPAEVRAEAHALKGSSRNLGVNPLGELFARLETLGKSGELAGASELLPAIEKELARAQEFLRAQI